MPEPSRTIRFAGVASIASPGRIPRNLGWTPGRLEDCTAHHGSARRNGPGSVEPRWDSRTNQSGPRMRSRSSSATSTMRWCRPRDAAARASNCVFSISRVSFHPDRASPHCPGMILFGISEYTISHSAAGGPDNSAGGRGLGPGSECHRHAIRGQGPAHPPAPGPRTGPVRGTRLRSPRGRRISGSGACGGSIVYGGGSVPPRSLTSRRDDQGNRPTRHRPRLGAERTQPAPARNEPNEAWRRHRTEPRLYRLKRRNRVSGAAGAG